VNAAETSASRLRRALAEIQADLDVARVSELLGRLVASRPALEADFDALEHLLSSMADAAEASR
jgi:hypothetical protein